MEADIFGRVNMALTERLNTKTRPSVWILLTRHLSPTVRVSIQEQEANPQVSDVT